MFPSPKSQTDESALTDSLLGITGYPEYVAGTSYRETLVNWATGQDALSQFAEWADSAGWTQDHRDQFVAIIQALAEEQAELAVPPTPTPVSTPTP